MTTLNLEFAKAVIEQAKRSMSPKFACKDCQHDRFKWPETEAEWPELFVKPDDLTQPYAIELTQAAKDAGWEGDFFVVIKCEPCKTRKTFPWAERLDAERVLQWMQARIDSGNDTPFWLGDLEHLA